MNAPTPAKCAQYDQRPGDLYVLFGFSSAVFWYGGWPFLKGFFEEIRSRRPGMMTLISVAVATAYLYSGAVVDGESSVNEAMLTGESTPVIKKSGGKVIGGAVNGEGSLTIEVKGTGKDSFLSQVIDLVKQAQDSKSKTQDLANTAALWLTIVALGGGVITLLIWLVFMSKDFAFAIECAVTVMVIACPTMKEYIAHSRRLTTTRSESSNDHSPDIGMSKSERQQTTNKKAKDNNMNTTKAEAIDPICGMTVDTATALHAERDGETFYFCGEHCREKFLSGPADAKPDDKSGGCCCG